MPDVTVYREVSELGKAVVAASAPTRLDRLVSYVSPAAGARRLQARASMALSRGAASALYRWGSSGYVGGRSDRNSTKEWHPYPGSADTDQLPGLDVLRSRSRDLVRNAPIAAGAINTTVTNVVGTGIQMQARPDRALLGLDDEKAEAWESRAELIWRTWCKAESCDVTGEQDFAGLQDLAMRAILESGDILMIRRFLPGGGPFATKIQLVEADRISNPDDAIDTAEITGGVERDANGRTTAYWVRNGHPGDSLIFGFGIRGSGNWTRVPAYGPVSGRRVAQLLYRRLRPGQTRGVPMLAPVVDSLKQVDRYLEAELMATVISSFFTVFVKSDLPESAGGGLAPVAGEVGDSDAAPAGDLYLGSGLIQDLAPGEDIEFANPSRPNQAFDDFMRSVLRQVGAAIEIPFEVLVKDFQSSYSAARSALLEAYRFYLTRRVWLSSTMCQPAYEDVLYEAALRDQMDAPGFLYDPVARQAWSNADWIGPAKGQIDPLKEIKAAKERVDLGVSSIARETAEISGGDWEATHRQLAREHRMRVAAGLEPEIADQNSAAGADVDPDVDPDEDPDEADRKELAA